SPLSGKIFQGEIALADQVDSLAQPVAVVVIILFTPEAVRAQFSLNHWQQLVERHRANVLRVHPQCFVVSPTARIVLLEVEDRIRAPDAFERKLLDYLLFAEYFFAF